MNSQQDVSTYLPVGIFDSGIGGLSVALPLQQRLPQIRLLYVADAGYAPYGELAPEQVIKRAEKITRFLINEGAGSIVVACNTATAIAVDHIRGMFDIPVVAMEPAIKPAMALSQSGTVAVLATAGTLGSKRYADLRDRHGHRGRVLECICHDWVKQVEKGELSTAKTRSLVARALEPIIKAQADVLVLGCTHFPFLETVIRDLVGDEVQVINPAPAVIDQLLRVLADSNVQAGLQTESQINAGLSLWSSGDLQQYQQLLTEITGQKFNLASFPEG